MLLCFIVCMALLASFFLPSAPLINMYAIRIISPIYIFSTVPSHGVVDGSKPDGE